MQASHPNLDLMQRVDPKDIAGCADVFHADVVWHFFNPELPDIAGDYVGVKGVSDFFDRMAKRTKGTFTVNVVDAKPIGDELVVVQSCNTLTLDSINHEVDVVIVWRVVDGKIAEVWDIPAVNSSRTTTS